MKSVKSILIILLFMAIMALLGYGKKLKEISDKDVQSYQDSINQLVYINYVIEAENDSLLNCNDSLMALPSKIKTIYREKYIVIEHSDIDQLDSIIRTELW